MADNRFPNDPYRRPIPNDDFGGRGDTELQPDPEPDGSSTNIGRTTLLAVVIALVLGGAFYGLNNTHVRQAGTEPPAQTAQTAISNTQPGTTTGSATNRPSAPQPVPSEPENYSPPDGKQ